MVFLVRVYIIYRKASEYINTQGDFIREQVRFRYLLLSSRLENRLGFILSNSSKDIELLSNRIKMQLGYLSSCY